MRLLSTFVSLVALLTMSSDFAADWKKELARPLVKVVSNQMVYEEFALCTVPPDNNDAEPSAFQMKTRSEAPHGQFISRDYFVAITAMLQTEILGQFGDVDCTPLKSPIGTPDLEIKLVMTQEGMQVETTDTKTGQKNRETLRWDDIFAEKERAATHSWSRPSAG